LTFILSMKPRKLPKKPPRDSDITWTNRYYGYVGLCSSQENDDRFSIENQRKRIAAWATIEEYVIVELVQEEPLNDESEGIDKGLLRILDMIQKGESLVITKLSLLSSSTRELLNIIGELDRRGCRLVSIHEGLDSKNIYGRFIITALSAVAELQEDLAADSAHRRQISSKNKTSENKA
jgi:DNA invertase Pin-like site-specific DNA recombinase